MWLMNMKIIQIMVMVLLIFTAIIDIKKKEIPFLLIGIGAGLAGISVAYGFVHGAADVETAIALFPGVVLVLISLVTRGEVGLGDGLMFLCIGPVYGLEQTIAGLLIALFISSLFSIGILALKKGNRKTKLPFIPFLSAGMGVALICANYLVI